MSHFEGFPPAGLRFLADLAQNNHRSWFDDHRTVWEEQLLRPAKLFVEAVGAEFARADIAVHAEPKINGSIFRINRDTRFSKDKSPYKTHLDMWFWQGTGPSRACPGYFLRLRSSSLVLGAGMHAFDKDVLAQYREDVIDDRRGVALVKAIEAVESAGPYDVGGQALKRVPRGFDAEHDRAQWLMHKGLHAGLDLPVAEEALAPSFPGFCAEHFRDLAPLQDWLVELVGSR